MSLPHVTPTNAGRISAAVYTAVSLAAAGAFLAVTLATGDYSWVARIGGAVWVFGLSMIILMPTVTPWLRARAAAAQAGGQEKEEATMVKDLVCGMEIDPASAAGTSEYKGTTYYFCATSCKKAFDAEPDGYIGKQ